VDRSFSSVNYEKETELHANLKLLTMELRKGLLRNGDRLGDQERRLTRQRAEKEVGWINIFEGFDDERGFSLLEDESEVDVTEEAEQADVEATNGSAAWSTEETFPGCENID
jgi:hypothetical protein